MSYMIGEIDIQNLLDARKRFEEFRQDAVTEQGKTATIKSFEFTYELAWKTIKKLLESRGIEAEIRSARSCFHEAASLGIIPDAKIWCDFIDIRNLTTHTYSRERINKIIGVLPIFSELLNEFLLHVGYHEQ